MAKNKQQKPKTENKKEMKKNYINPSKTVFGKILIVILIVGMVAGILTGLGFMIWQLLSQV